MPITNQTLNNNLYDNLYAQGYKPDPLDSIGKEAAIDDADVFRIHFTSDDGEDGHAWMAVLDGELILWADNKFINMSKYENFNKFWKTWAQRQTLRWNVTNRDRLVGDMKKRTAMKKKEDQLNEGYYALGKQKSYSDSVPAVKLIIQHTRQLEEGEQRFRNIAKIFVENAGGERFLLPTNRPGLARVFARHIAEGGTPYDDKGRHITTLVEEYTKMAGFVRATRNGQFNESALKLVNEGLMHYNSLRMTLQGMTSHRGYNKYFESYTPVLNEEADDDTSLNELFVEETLDPRIESVMPILKRLSKNINEMSAVKELEEWAQAITEVEDETTKTLAEPAADMLDEAPGAETLAHNDATEKSNLKAFDLAEEDLVDEELENEVLDTVSDDLMGDMDEGVLGNIVNKAKSMFTKPGQPAAPATAAPVVPDAAAKARMAAAPQGYDPNTGKPKVAAKAAPGAVAKSGTMDMTKKVTPAAKPAAAPAPAQSDYSPQELAQMNKDLVAMADIELNKAAARTNLDPTVTAAIKAEVARRKGVAEDLDADQKRVGQLGPTDKVKNNNIGKLVGASESKEFDDIKRLAGLK